MLCALKEEEEEVTEQDCLSQNETNLRQFTASGIIYSSFLFYDSQSAKHILAKENPDISFLPSYLTCLFFGHIENKEPNIKFISNTAPSISPLYFKYYLHVHIT